MRHRVPDGTPEQLASLADESMETLARVLRDEGNPMTAFARLQAARSIREEICGPIPKKLEHGGSNGGPLTFHIDISGADSPGPEEES